MSVGEMSAMLRERILAQVEKAVLGKNPQLTQRILNNHLEYSNRERIRSDTNASSESVMSRGSLEALKAQMQEYLEANSIGALSENIIKSLDFDDFKQYLLDNYFKGKVTTSSRKEEGFQYSNPLRLSGSSKSTKLVIGSSTDTERDVLILKNIAYDKIVVYFKEYIFTKVGNISDQDKAALTTYLTNMFNAGHLAGVFTGRLIRAFELKTDKKTGALSIAGSTDPQLVQLMQNVLELVTAADFLSSNLVNDVGLFARSSKQLTKSFARLNFVTEVQISTNNKEAGNLLTQAGAELTKLIKSIDPTVSQKGKEKAIGEQTKKLFAKLKPVRDYVVGRAQTLKKNPKISDSLKNEIQKALATSANYDVLISTSGSDPATQHIANLIADAIDSKKRRAKASNSSASVNKKLKPAKQGKPVNNVNLASKKVVAKFKAVQKASAQPDSLVSLYLLLTQLINKRVAENMGSGASRNVLNYRTGRLADSVKIENLTQSRAGMLSVFYSYMKNPYATFSSGGKQQFPRSRDPKLLISKSIREILHEQAVTNLRSVLV